MREIKFEICTRRKDGSDLFIEILMLEQLVDRNGCYYSPSVQEIVYKRQYTGLKDKNGVEIYEGDILSNGINAEGFVKFVNGMFVCNFKYNSVIEEYAGESKTFKLINCNMVCSITGNIHQSHD